MTTVIKAGGEKEEFDEEKFLASIRRAGVGEKEQGETLSHLKSHLYDNIPTAEIYDHVFNYLGSSDKPFSKSKYSLKQSVMMLGPTGYPFEDFVSDILIAQNYQTRVRQILFGKCVSHEVDVIAEKDNKVSMIEAKFHNNPGARSEIQVALYTQSRFLDVKEKYHFDDAWIVTNTKTTVDANAYASCMGLKVLSWSYPLGSGLREIIPKHNLYPITLLTTLSNEQKKSLLKDHLVLCKNLQSNLEYLKKFLLSNKERDNIIEELDYILK